MEKEIYLYPDNETVRTEGIVPFVCTNRFFSDAAKFALNANELIDQLKGRRILLVLPTKGKEEISRSYVNVLMDDVILNCSITEGLFKIVSLYPKKNKDHYRFIKYSIKIFSLHGATIEYSTRNGRQVVGNISDNEYEIQKKLFTRVIDELVTKVTEVKLDEKDYDNDPDN